MSCPCFFPEARLSDGFGAVRLPLGDAYSGRCEADAAASFFPDEKTAGSLCNMGYARGTCARFPSGIEPDAVRFVIIRDSGDTIGLRYALEKDHGPWAHGALEYSAAGEWPARHPNLLIQRQAEAYLESYLRRKPRMRAAVA